MWIKKFHKDDEEDKRSPIPTQVISNEEYLPRQQTKQQKQVEDLIQSPLDKIDKLDLKEIETPRNLFTDRKNSLGIDLSEEDNISFAKAVLRIYDLDQDKYDEISKKCLNLFHKNYTVEKVFSRISNVLLDTYISSKSDK